MLTPDSILDFWVNLSIAAAKHSITDDLDQISQNLVLISGEIFALNKVLPHDAPAQSTIRLGTNRTITVCADLVNFLHGGDFDHNKYGLLSPADENPSLENLTIDLDRTMKLGKGFADTLISIANQLQKIRMLFIMFRKAKNEFADLATIGDLAQEVSTPWEIFSGQNIPPPTSSPKTREITELHQLTYGWCLNTKQTTEIVEGGLDSLSEATKMKIYQFHAGLCQGKTPRLIGAMQDETGGSIMFWTKRSVPDYPRYTPPEPTLAPNPLIRFTDYVSQGKQVLDMVNSPLPEQLKRSGAVENFEVVTV